MKHLQTFRVFPNIPEPISFLEPLSRNIWWCWQTNAVELFRRIDPNLWSWSGRNPIRMLTFVPQTRLEDLAEDRSFLSHMQRVREEFDGLACCRMKDYDQLFTRSNTIAYFSMEFGIHESIPLFAGGLGILAGDHLKSASDMEMPLVAMGLLYRQGYFRQLLNQDGWQQEEYPETDLSQMPIEKARDAKNRWIIVPVEGPGGVVQAAVWRINVGCIPLYLLDTNIPHNSPENREVTAKLYVGDEGMRVAQEMVLGIGGIRALDALNIEPAVCHMNEGHSAFSSLERLAYIMGKYRVDLKTALEIVPRTTVFTTHTPVAAGNEEFPVDLIRPYFQHFESRLGIPVEKILEWGQHPGSSPDSPVSMFVLGARMAAYRNGVSQLHGRVARRMWRHLWPRRPGDEVPIGHVTNGIHVSSYLSSELSQLFDRYIGPDWHGNPSLEAHVKRIDDIYEEELWRAHTMSRARLIRACRRLMVRQYKRRNAPKDVLKDAELVLDQDILTIAFARRFATYKRANLLLQNPERFKALLTNTTRPVQFVFAGKAHPRDNEGKEFIRRLVHFARDPAVRNRMVFVENYDIHIARYLVQGADIWLNNPRRPLEACGTSGMKAAINGVLNVSILDGWWCEGYAEDRGWRIGNGEEYEDHGYQDAIESQALYNVLEDEVLPCYYDRKNGNIPFRWIRMMKESMKMSIQHFCSHRMVEEYDRSYYQPGIAHFASMLKDDARKARDMAAQQERLTRLWNKIRLQAPVRQADGPFRVGETFQITVMADLDDLSPDDVTVELYYGILRGVDRLTAARSEPMEMIEAHGNGRYLYACDIRCAGSGRFGFTVRAMPRGDDFTRYRSGFISWSE
ncbi:MAG: alpha-glucan phosphorylase [Desulfococcus sp.]|nr:MAG: alpha-glucan phosphorylase [Desulfococcus sp.]